MSIRPVDLQVAVPRMADVDRGHKVLEQPQHSQMLTNEVKQVLLRKEQEVQRHDEVRDVSIHQRQKRENSHGESNSEEDAKKKNRKKQDSATVKPVDHLRGRKIDIRI